jgi:lysophospholipase L1-like esterase
MQTLANILGGKILGCCASFSCVYNIVLMRRALPWAIALISLICFGASFSELQRLRRRFAEATHHNYHDHRDVRQFIIKTSIDELPDPIVVIGDSIVEMAPLPDTVCGHALINAGVGGATFSEIRALLPRLFENHRSYMIVVGLGANEANPQTVAGDFRDLSRELRKVSERTAAFSTSPDDSITIEVKSVSDIRYLDAPLPRERFDGLHLTHAKYSIWLPKLLHAIECECGHS